MMLSYYSVTCVKIKDNIVATGSSDRTIRLRIICYCAVYHHCIRIWDIESMKCVRTLIGHQVRLLNIITYNYSIATHINF